MAVVTEGTNSYCSTEFAYTYFETRLHAESWDDGIPSIIALIQACKLMETRVKWKGAKASKTQTLQWPRTGLTDLYNDAVPNDEIPDIVKETQCELALYIIESDPYLVPGGIETINFSGLKINTNPKQETIPGKVFKPIAHWGTLLDNSNHRLTR
ncbi:MAG: hypothetical protein RBR67_19690 [Desulfobacterium sp.]|nr:hypothetical protein [Desulfobacterium sp.]